MKKDLYYLAPKKYREFFKSQIMYAGIKESATNRIVGISYFLAIILFLNSTVIFLLFGFGAMSILLGLGVGFAVIVFTYLFFMLIADSRANQIEKVLPDALQLISANVRAGMTIDRAIWLSARPEFGVLEEEIKMVGARTMGGKPLKVAFTEMTKSVKSKILDRSIKLLLEGIESGGEMAHLLEEVAENVRTTQTLKKEIKSSVMTYSIFILFAAVIAAPFLFSISIFFVDTMTNLWGSANLGSAISGSSMGMGSMFSKAKGPQISTDDLFWFSVAALTVSSFFGALTIGLIQTGKEKNGLRLIPMLLITSIAILVIALTVVKMLFKGFFAM
jgi:flagellar protein FlaJ